MKIVKFLIAVAMLTAFSAKAQESLEAMREKYDARLAEIQAGFEANKQDLFAKYVRSLEVLEERTKAKGDLDGVLVVRSELTRFGKGQDLSETNIVETAGELQEIQQRCLSAYAGVQVEWANDVVKLCGMYDAALERQEKSLTANNELEDALKVREARQISKESVEFGLARKRLSQIVNLQIDDKQKKADSVISFKSPIVEGFGQIMFAPNSGNYPNYRNVPATAYWTYSGNGQFIEWRTAKVPSNFLSSDVVFVWGGSNSNRLGEFDLYFNDKKAIAFTSQQRVSKKWISGNVIFEFKYINNKADNSGLFVLTVPSSWVVKGNPQTIRIDARAKEKSLAWIMVCGFDDATKDF